MTATVDWSGRTAVVIGAGSSGVAAAELLHRCGATVTLTDARPAEQLPELARLSSPVEVVVGGHPDSLWEAADTAVVSPGIPPTAPPVLQARAHGLRVVSELELAAPMATAPAVAITGSNGKSTVTSMVGAILQEAGIDAAVCGNIGVPLSRIVHQELDGETHVDVYVLELSSFQTESIDSFHPRWAAILNVSADHLDRHGDMHEYTLAKLVLLRNCGSDDFIVYGADDVRLASCMPPTAATLVPFSARPLAAGPGAWLDGGQLLWRAPDGSVTTVMRTDDISAIGTHNLLNACAATALACLAGATPEAAGRALTLFSGLEHRMEPCGTIGGVECINDSKATNVGATLAALSGLDRDVWLILGGRDKDSDFNLLRAAVRQRVRRVLLVGEASGQIAASLQGAAPMVSCGRIENAIDVALEDASVGDVLLLAPACTSFDQFDNFEHRGRHFKTLVAARAQAGTTPAPDPRKD